MFLFLIPLVCLAGIFLFTKDVSVTKVEGAEKININTASLTELDTLPGIGPIKAQAIIDYRTQNGAFQKIEDIMNVSGIGEATFNDLKDLITVGEGGDGQGQGNNNEQQNYSDKIVVNEILPNPEGSDDFEWLELKNIGEAEVDLKDWIVADASGSEYAIKSNDFSSTILAANGFLVLEKSITGISLNNTGGETIKLFQPNRNLLQTVAYSDDATEDVSWARNENGNYQWTTTLTKGAENVITTPSTESTSGGGGGVGETIQEETEQLVYSDKILITETLPNPVGLDEGVNEWLEIYNTSTDPIWMQFWKLRDNQNESSLPALYLPSKSFLILTGQETKLILNNSGGDFLELRDEKDKLVARVNYAGAAPEGETYNLCGKKWQWLKKATPGKENFCPLPDKKTEAFFEVSQDKILAGEPVIFDAHESYGSSGMIIKYSWHFEKPVLNLASRETKDFFEIDSPVLEVKFLSGGKQKVTLKVLDSLETEDTYSQTVEVKAPKENSTSKEKSQSSQSSAGQVKSAMVNQTNLENVRKMKIGSQVEVTGIVAVEPGVLGVNIFYLAGSGIQIYCYKKDFPGLALGDTVKVQGEISQAYNELRIKINDKNDVTIIKSGLPPLAHEVGLDEIGDEWEGSLLKLTGEITSLRSEDFWLDDGSGEIRVVIKKTTGISLSERGLKIGDRVMVTGILSEIQSGFRLLPRYQSDLVIQQVAGEQDVKKDKSSPAIMKYLLVAAGATIIVLLAIIIKRKTSLPKN